MKVKRITEYLQVKCVKPDKNGDFWFAVVPDPAIKPLKLKCGVTLPAARFVPINPPKAVSK